MDLRYEYESASGARQADGQAAPNPSSEVVEFKTAYMSLRYGLTDRVNLMATVPWLSISSAKIQGEPYTRSNVGIGDALVMGSARVLESPEVLIEAGLRLPTGSTDNTDGLGTRINDILALGSGTLDPVVGASAFKGGVFGHHVDAFASVRYRHTGGTNKWGYHFGDEVQYSLGLSGQASDRVRITPTLSGYRIGEDTWVGNTVPERGAAFLNFSTEVAWRLSRDFSLGAFYQVPVRMRLTGAQMVAEHRLGLTGSMGLSSVWDRLHRPSEAGGVP